VAYLVANNSRKNGFSFFRSFIFILLLFAVVIAFLMKQFNAS